MNETIQTVLKVLVIFVLILVFEKFREKKKLKTLRKQKPGFPKQDYLQYFERQGFNRIDIENLYDRLKEFLAEDRFELHPDDDFHKDYGIVDLDDVDLINQVCDNLGLPHPDDEEYDYVNQKYSVFNALSTLTLIEKIQERKSSR